MKKQLWKRTSLAVVLALVLCVPMAGCFSLPESDPVYDIVGTSHGMYAYETLTEEEQVVYDEIAYAIEHRLESIKVSTTDEALLDKAHWAVYYDHCEYFWSETYQYEVYTNYKDEIVKLVFMPIYTVDEETQAAYQEQIDQRVQEILAGAPVDGTDYDKAMYVYKTLIAQTDYDMDAEHNQNIISVFVNDETVCLGYSYGAQYLLNQLDIPCTTVFGVSEGQNHSWNLLQMDGDYYYMDVTWGEVSYWEEVDQNLPEQEGANDQDATSTDGLKGVEIGSETINYSYFGVSDADAAFMAEHRAYDHVPMPACSATQNNYYIHEGLYFEEWDRVAVGEKIREYYEKEEPAIFLKFATSEAYDKAFQYLIERGNWYRYCDEKQILYVDQFEENVLMIEF